MRRPLLLAAVGLVATALTATGPVAAAAPGHGHGHKRVCAPVPAAGTASCTAEVRTKGGTATPDATTTFSSGYTPAQLQKAYNVPTPARTATIAIVDAYANPNAQSDLNVYRSKFGLGTKTITQYRQNGTLISSRNRPAANVGWGQEEALDLDMASAICPTCNLIYVGANSSRFTDLLAAVKIAHQHATVVSNSYGGSEFSGEDGYTATYNVPGHISTISSGDDGYGVSFPAALSGQYVASVGGTSLQLKADGTRSSETVWSGAGSGCSAYISKPKWQTDTGCANRSVSDVSAVADPATGVAVYDSYGSTGKANWYVFGGTSVAAPIIGAYYAAAGIPTGGVADTYSAAANGSANLFDVTSGSNGTCAAAYLCTGTAGYDGPSGLGTPTGVVGF